VLFRSPFDTSCQTVEQLVSKGLALGDGGQTAILHLCGVEGDGVLGELEALLDQRRELANAAALLAEDLLRVRGADDDVGDGGSDADLDARVAFFGQFALEEFVEFGVEDTVCLLPLANDSNLQFRLPRSRLGFPHRSIPSCIPRSHINIVYLRVRRTSNELSPLGAVIC